MKLTLAQLAPVAINQCDYCEAPWTHDTAFGLLCSRHNGYLELATVICYPEYCTSKWAYKRGAQLRLKRGLEVPGPRSP